MDPQLIEEWKKAHLDLIQSQREWIDRLKGHCWVLTGLVWACTILGFIGGILATKAGWF